MSNYTRFPRARQLTRAAAALALVGATVFACSEATSPDQSGMIFGPVTAVAGGTGRAYVILDRAGAPTDLGVAVTETAFAGLPAASTEFVLPLPAEALATPYKHAVLNWIPLGHPGPEYMVPHFDVHFYTITNEARDALTIAADPELNTKMARLPAAAFAPAGYEADGNAVPRMGKHWRDASSPERNGQPFTATIFYGSYDGVFIFAEPMIARAYLETKPAPVVMPLKLPMQYATPAYYPTSYTVGYNAATSEYRVALSGLVRR